MCVGEGGADKAIGKGRVRVMKEQIWQKEWRCNEMVVQVGKECNAAEARLATC